MHPARSPQDRCCLFIHGISADGTGTLTTGLAVRRGQNGLASCQSACHSSDEPRVGSADLHADHSVVREPHIQKTPCGHMAASAVVCGRPKVAIESPKGSAMPLMHAPHTSWCVYIIPCECMHVSCMCTHTLHTHTHTHKTNIGGPARSWLTESRQRTSFCKSQMLVL